jgi:D-alanine-D-alanine ligase
MQNLTASPSPITATKNANGHYSNFVICKSVKIKYMKRVAVLRGGTSNEYRASMITGDAVLSALLDSPYPHRDIVITKSGDWLTAGKRVTPDQALEGIDVVFIALQGELEQDSVVQEILKRKRIPYTGSKVLAAGFARNKELAKQTMRSAGIQTPKHRRIGQSEKHELQKELEQIILDLGTNLYLKPLLSKSPASYRSVQEAHELEGNLVEMLDMYDDLLVEETVAGIPAQVSVLANFRGQDLYTLPANELAHDYVRPGRFSPVVKNELARAAKLAHQAVGCSQYSLIDFIVNGDEVTFLKIDSCPELSVNQQYALSADSIGLTYRDLIFHLITTAIIK